MGIFFSQKTLLLLIGLCWFSFSWGQGEKYMKINRYFEDSELSLALIKLKYDYGLVFEYDKELIEGHQLKNVRITRLPLDQAMAVLLKGTELDFEIVGKTKILIKEKEAFVPTIYSPTRFKFTLKGAVVDRKNGETLPHASVVIKGTQTGALTNGDGYFSIFNVPSDTVTLMVKYLGYKTAFFQITPDTDVNKMQLAIQVLDVELDEVLIVAEEERMMKSKGISHIAISPAQVSTLPSLGEKDIFRSLQLLPGISGTNETSSGLYVRGGTPDQNLILYDGFTVYHVDHFFGFFSAFNAEAVKDVQLYKGGFEAQYGGRISSVVELTGKSGNKKEFDMGVGLSALSANLRLEAPIGDKLTFFVAGRRSYTDIIQSGLYANLYDLVSPTADTETQMQPQGGRGPGGQQFTQTVPSFYFYDLNAKVTYTPTERDVVAVSFYNGQDNLDNSFDGSTNFGRPGATTTNNTFTNETVDLTAWGNWGLSGKWARQWNDRFYTNSVLAYSNYYSNRDRTQQTSITQDTVAREINQGLVEDNDVKDITLRIDNTYQISGSNQIEFGGQITYNDISYSYLVNDTVNVIDRANQGTQYAAYLQDSWTLGTKLNVNLGVRGTYYDVTNKFYVEPRASFSFQATERIQLKGAWGKYNQFTNRVVREDVLQGSRDFWLLSDGATIPISSATHYIAGIAYETPNFLVDVEAYYKDLNGLSEFSQRISQNRRDVTISELFYEGTGTAKGLEFLVQKKLGDYTGWISYTLSKVLYDFEAFGEDPFPALHDQTHEFKVVNSLKVGKWTFGATWVYSTGKPFTAPVGGYALELLDGSFSDYVHVGDKNSFRLPDYHRMDLSATLDFRLGNGKASAGLSIFNVYSRNNIWYKEFDIVDGELITTDVQLLGITPNLFLNFNLR